MNEIMNAKSTNSSTLANSLSSHNAFLRKINILHSYANTVGSLDLGVQPSISKKIESFASGTKKDARKMSKTQKD